MSLTTVVELLQVALSVAPDVEKLIAAVEKVLADWKADRAKVAQALPDLPKL
jgi:hypothetical protein